MKKFLLAIMLALASTTALTGCTTLQSSTLDKFSPEVRSSYRKGLDEAGKAIEEGKTFYDSRYDKNGNLLPVPPAPIEPPVETK